MRGSLQISQKKLPKRAFRAKLPTIFREEGSKMIVSCEASSKFRRTSFQNERFARCFRQFSQKKLPKGSFRARFPPDFTEEASKTTVSRDASDSFDFSRNHASKTSVSRDAFDNFHRKNFQKDRKLKMEKNSPKKWKEIPRKVLDPYIYLYSVCVVSAQLLPLEGYQ